MRATFFDPDAQRDLETLGYAIIDFLDADEIAEIQDIYDDLGTQPGDPQVACVDTFFCEDVIYKENVHERIAHVFDRHLSELFDRQHVLSYCFVNKWSSDRSGFGLHQDISVVDEREHTSVELWCPTVDTDEENGQLWVVPGSHRWRWTPRPIHGYEPPWWPVRHRIMSRHAIPVPVKAGQAVVFNHALVHFSHANRSGRPRLVAACDLRPVESEHVHYTRDFEAATVVAHPIDDGFWIDIDPFSVVKAFSELESSFSVPYEREPLTDEELDRLVAAGQAVDHPEQPHPDIHSKDPWCFRCGTTEGVEGEIDTLLGNVTLLCPSCASTSTAVG